MGVEEGKSEVFEVKLKNQPSGDVTVSISRQGDSNLGSNPSVLTFTPSNWNTPQNVTVTAQSDADSTNGEAVFTLTATGLASTTVTVREIDTVQDFVTLAVMAEPSQGGTATGGSNTVLRGSTRQIVATPSQGWVFSRWESVFSGISIANPTSSATTVTVSNNGAVKAIFTTAASATLQVSPTSLTAPEGGSGTFEVRLTAQPSGDTTVSVNKVSGGDVDLSASPSSLVFTTTNWATPQTVTVTASEDGDTTDGTAVFTMTPNGGGLSATSITAKEADNDTWLGGKATPDQAGSVTVGGAPPGFVTKGTPVQISASPSAGYTFLNWSFISGAGSFANSNSPSTTVTITNQSVVTANFELACPTVGPPSNLQAVTVAATSATVAWTAGAGATGYQYQSGINTNWSGVTSSVSSTNALLTGLQPGISSWYRVRATNSCGNASEWVTNNLTTCSLPGNVVGMNIDNVTPSSVQISWMLTERATSWKWQVSTDSSFSSIERSGSATSSPLVITGLRSGVSYHFRVWGENACGQGPSAPGAVSTQTADNSPPTVVITGLSTALSGQMFRLVATASDPDPADTSFSWSWEGSGWRSWEENESCPDCPTYTVDDSQYIGEYYGGEWYPNEEGVLVESGPLVLDGSGRAALMSLSDQNGSLRRSPSAYTLYVEGNDGSWNSYEFVANAQTGQIETGTPIPSSSAGPGAWCYVYGTSQDGSPVNVYYRARATDPTGASGEDWHTVAIIPMINVEVDTADGVVPEGETREFDVRLSSAPAIPSTIEIRKEDGDADLVLESGGPMIFNASNWQVPQKLVVSASEDEDTEAGSAQFGVYIGDAKASDFFLSEGDNDAILIVAADPEEGGSVLGGGIVTKGTPSDISTTPSQGYVFKGWRVSSGQGTITAPNQLSTSVTLDGDATVLADYGPVTYTLVVQTEPTMNSYQPVIVSPAGTERILAGTPKILTAPVTSEWKEVIGDHQVAFSHWRLEDLDTGEIIAEEKLRSLPLTINRNLRATAVYNRKLAEYEISVKPDNAVRGSVEISQEIPELRSGEKKVTRAKQGDSVTLTAVPAPGFELSEWVYINDEGYETGAGFWPPDQTSVTFKPSSRADYVAVFRPHGDLSWAKFKTYPRTGTSSDMVARGKYCVGTRVGLEMGISFDRRWDDPANAEVVATITLPPGLSWGNENLYVGMGSVTYSGQVATWRITAAQAAGLNYGGGAYATVVFVINQPGQYEIPGVILSSAANGDQSNDTAKTGFEAISEMPVDLSVGIRANSAAQEFSPDQYQDVTFYVDRKLLDMLCSSPNRSSKIFDGTSLTIQLPASATSVEIYSADPQYPTGGLSTGTTQYASGTSTITWNLGNYSTSSLTTSQSEWPQHALRVRFKTTQPGAHEISANLQTSNLDFYPNNNSVRMSYDVVPALADVAVSMAMGDASNPSSTDTSSGPYKTYYATVNAEFGGSTMRTYVGDPVVVKALGTNLGAVDAEGVVMEVFIPSGFDVTEVRIPQLWQGGFTTSWRDPQGTEGPGRVLVVTSMKKLLAKTTEKPSPTDQAASGNIILTAEILGTFSQPGNFEFRSVIRCTTPEEPGTNNEASASFSVGQSKKMMKIVKRFERLGDEGWESANSLTVGQQGRFIVELQNHAETFTFPSMSVFDLVPDGFTLQSTTVWPERGNWGNLPSGVARNVSGNSVQYSGTNYWSPGRQNLTAIPDPAGHSRSSFIIPVRASTVGTYTNVAEVSLPPDFVALGGNSASAVVTIEPCKDRLSLTSSESSVSRGDQISYDFEATASVETAQFSGQVRITIPSGWSYVNFYDYEPNEATATVAGNTLIINIPTASETYSDPRSFRGTVILKPGASASLGETLVQAYATSNTGCSNPAAASVGTVVKGPDIGVEVIPPDANNPVSTCSETVSVRVRVRNNSSVPVTGISLNVGVTGDGTIQPTTLPAGVTMSNGIYTIQSIAGGTHLDLPLPVKSSSPASGSGQFRLSAAVTAQNDTNSENNQSAAELVVICPPAGTEPVIHVRSVEEETTIEYFGFELDGQYYLDYTEWQTDEGWRDNTIQFRKASRSYTFRGDAGPGYHFVSCGGVPNLYPVYATGDETRFEKSEGTWSLNRTTQKLVRLDPKRGEYVYDESSKIAGSAAYTWSESTLDMSNEDGQSGYDLWRNYTTTSSKWASIAGTEDLDEPSLSTTAPTYSSSSRHSAGKYATSTHVGWSSSCWTGGTYELPGSGYWSASDMSVEDPDASLSTIAWDAISGVTGDIERWGLKWECDHDESAPFYYWDPDMICNQDYYENRKYSGYNDLTPATDYGIHVGWWEDNLSEERRGTGNRQVESGITLGSPVTEENWKAAFDARNQMSPPRENFSMSLPVGIEIGVDTSTTRYWAPVKMRTAGHTTFGAYAFMPNVPAANMVFIFAKSEGGGLSTRQIVVSAPRIQLKQFQEMGGGFAPPELTEGWIMGLIRVSSPDGRNITVTSMSGDSLGTLPPGYSLVGVELVR
jgi:hypothetical protein